MELIVNSLAPLMLLILLGYILQKSGVASKEWVEVLNKVAIYILFPSLIFSGVIDINLATIESFSFIYINFAILILIIIFTFVVTKYLGFPKDMINTYVTAIFYGNIGYLGFPILHSLMPGFEGIVSIHIAIYTFLLFTLGIAILELSVNKKIGLNILIDALKNPLIVSVWLSTILLLLDIKIATVLKSSIDILAGGATPIILISLGVFLARELPKIRYKDVVILVFIKLIVMPLIFYGVYLALGEPKSLAISVLEAGMPIAITPYILAQIYPLKGELVAFSIVASCLLAIFTLPIFMFLTGVV